jgi:hypothetical protein
MAFVDQTAIAGRALLQHIDDMHRARLS